ERIEQLRRQLADNPRVITPFASLAVPTGLEAQLRVARAYVADRHPTVKPPLWKGERYAHDRIRVAYLSADFHAHATSYLMAELLERHERRRLEIPAIRFGRAVQDEMQRRLSVAFDRFIDVHGRSDRDIAQLLRELEIDIAVDLKGLTQGARPGILAHRPAP